MVGFSYFDLIINYKGKVGRIYDIDPNMYCYIDALKDVTKTVLSHIDYSEAIAITLHCDMPEVNEEYNEDNVYGFSDEDRDWNASVDSEHESNGTVSLSDEDNERSNEDDGLSDYQSGDDEVRYSSSDDEFDGEVD
ncbi:hypothetical protein CsSME_00027803 [Camellia sinensis var. sinensis]